MTITDVKSYHFTLDDTKIDLENKLFGSINITTDVKSKPFT